MHFAFIADPLDHLKIYKDSTFAMIEEAAQRRHQISYLTAADLTVEDGKVYATAGQLFLTGDPHAWFQQGEPEKTALTAFDAVIMRKDPPFDSEYLYATHLMTLSEKQGALCINSGQALRDHNEKLAILEFPEWISPTTISSQYQVLRDFILEHQDVILKPLDSMGGDSIFRVTDHDPNLSVILELMTRQQTRTIMAQRYIPAITDGDKRVLLIDGVPVDYCLARIPKDGETRGNLAAGGRGEARPLSDTDRAIAEALGPVLRERGLLLVGLDIIGDRLTEINVTSPTCFREIMQQTGCPVASLFIDAVERAVQQHQQASV